jgi:hypothetical protein
MARQTRKIESRRMPGYTGLESCQRLATADPGDASVDACIGRNTRHYGEDTHNGEVTGFTGWRGPYCSVRCYKLVHPEENGGN